MAARKKAEETGAELTRTLTEGDSGDDVKILQEFVLTESTGEYDAVTTKAVKVWQKARNLPVTGSISETDLRRIQRDLGTA